MQPVIRVGSALSRIVFVCEPALALPAFEQYTSMRQLGQSWVSIALLHTRSLYAAHWIGLIIIASRCISDSMSLCMVHSVGLISDEGAD